MLRHLLTFLLLFAMAERTLEQVVPLFGQLVVAVDAHDDDATEEKEELNFREYYPGSTVAILPAPALTDWLALPRPGHDGSFIAFFPAVPSPPPDLRS
jgi:hypothetical protein